MLSALNGLRFFSIVKQTIPFSYSRAMSSIGNGFLNGFIPADHHIKAATPTAELDKSKSLGMIKRQELEITCECKNAKEDLSSMPQKVQLAEITITIIGEVDKSDETC